MESSTYISHRIFNRQSIYFNILLFIDTKLLLNI